MLRIHRWSSLLPAAAASLVLVALGASEEPAAIITCPNSMSKVSIGPCEPWVPTGCFNTAGSGTWGGTTLRYKSINIVAKADVMVTQLAAAGPGYLPKTTEDCRDITYWSGVNCTGMQIGLPTPVTDRGTRYDAIPCPTTPPGGTPVKGDRVTEEREEVGS